MFQVQVSCCRFLLLRIGIYTFIIISSFFSLFFLSSILPTRSFHFMLYKKRNQIFIYLLAEAPYVQCFPSKH